MSPMYQLKTFNMSECWLFSSKRDSIDDVSHDCTSELSFNPTIITNDLNLSARRKIKKKLLGDK